jgi:2-polyprenyl-3-methyl-5-hydroxy-6-metoxy-1,4-benzoquinol methylase
MSNEVCCRLSGAPLEVVLDLGVQPLGNGFISPKDYASEYFYSLQCGFSEDSQLFQLIEQPSPNLMFHDNYAFFSGTSQRMKNHFANFARDVLLKGYMNNDSAFIVELGSNDGIFLEHFAQRDIQHLGVEPSGAVAEVAESLGIRVTRKFFNRSLALEILGENGPADVITAANVMCHIPDIHELAQGISSLLKPDGVLIFEDPYLGDVVRLTSYDQIYDEHVFLFSALSVQSIFGTVGMTLIDLEPQTTHGGSMRYTLAKIGARQESPRVQEILARERVQGLDQTRTFVEFADRVRRSAEKLRETLENVKDQGKSIAAYGATSKSTTIYNYAGISSELIDYICDNTPVKQGMVSPGAHIPIVAENHFRLAPPDFAFLAAWNHEQELRNRNTDFTANGGQWITHVPEVRFLD